jgi:hypothetical protein
MEYRRAEGHLRVRVREYDADGKPQGGPFDLPTDKAHELVYDRVWVYPRGLKLGHRCTVTEQDVRDLRPSPSTPTAALAHSYKPITLSEKPKETVETRLINLMNELHLKSGMFPREVLKAVKRPYKKEYHDEPSQSAVTRAYNDYKAALTGTTKPSD